MDLPYKNCIVIAVAAACFLIASIVLITEDVFTDLVRGHVKKLAVLQLNGEILQQWKEPPIEIYTDFFIFNITNPREVLEGKKPIVKELGPYVYREYRSKVDIVFYENNTVSAISPKSFVFEKDTSVGNPKEETVTVINLPMITMLTMAKQGGIIEEFILSLLSNMQHIHLFQTHTVDELLWGYEDPLLKEFNKLFPQLMPDPHFGLFYGMNGSHDGVYLFHTGYQDYMKFNQIMKWEGKEFLSWWTSDSCNMINGTDGAVFHPFVQKDETLYLFASDLCRSAYVTYEQDMIVEGIKTYRFTVPKQVFQNATENPDNAGFCTPPGNCYPSGLLDVSSCRYGAPLFMSSPHFYMADQKLIDDITGLQPNKEAHETFLDIEPRSGAPVRVAKRLQISIKAEAVENVTQTGKIRTMILPVIYLIERATIDSETAKMIKSQLLLMEFTENASYLFLSVGLLLAIVAFILAIVTRQKKKHQAANDTSRSKEKHTPDNNYESMHSF